MWVCAGRTEQVEEPRPVLRPRAARREHRRHARPGRGQRVLQRLPAPRHAAVHRGARHVSRQHPVPVSRLDLRPRRPPDRRAAHGRSAALPQGRLPAAPGRRRRCGTGTSSSTSIRRPRRSTAQLGALPAKFRPWRMEDLRLGHRIVYDVKANWKLIVQNYNECLHCPNLHPALNKLSHYLSGENEPLQATYMGGRMDLRPGVDTLSMDGTCPRAFLPRTCRPRSGGASTTTRSFRTCCSACTPTTCWCTRCGRSRRTARSTSASGTSSPPRLPRPGSDPADAVEFWDMTNRQDWHVCELSQAGISSRGLHAGAVLESRGSAVRVRPDDRGAARRG